MLLACLYRSINILELRGYTVVIKMFFVKNLVGMYACR